MKEKYFYVAKTISKWKLDNWFENWVGYKADNSNFWKALYLFYYKLFDTKYYYGGIKLAQKEIEKRKGVLPKSVFETYSEKDLQNDLIYSLHRFGVCYSDYFVFKFYSLNTYGREQFVQLKNKYGYCDLVNSPGVRNLFENKGNCYRRLGVYFKRDLVSSELDGNDKIFNFLSKHKKCIYKPIDGHSGNGIKILESSDVDINSLKQSGSFVLEELIEQGEPMSCLHPESINTVRVSTFKTNCNIEVVGVALRMGCGDSFVDNAGAGGIFASVDIPSGIVTSVARNIIDENVFVFHPKTQVKIVGFQLPNWEEAITLVKSAFAEIEEAHMIDWDLAYSKSNGWVLVEANDVGEPYLLQAPYQKGMKNKYIELLDNF